MKTFRIGVVWIVADSASEALRTNTAREAHVGDELLADDGTVLATKRWAEVEPGSAIETWEATSAWPDLEPPVDLDRLLGDREAAS